jgi:hypothetical protein
MGYGAYSYDAHRALADAKKGLPREQIFTQRKCHPLMDPHGVRLRESRDSDTHPESLGIVFALDVTGSMGAIPDHLAREELPAFMKSLRACGVADAQVLFVAAGDATCDSAPLQVGQFESEAELMDQWLTWTFLEGGGGGQNTESYELALYFIARHTAMDCWEKRNKRGYVFMTGDENPYPLVSKRQVEGLIGDTLDDDLSVEAVVAELQVTYEPFFLIPDARRAARCERVWRDLLGDHVILLEKGEHTCHASAALVGLCEGALADVDAVAKRLVDHGVARADAHAVVRSVTPFAASLGKDGPAPHLAPPRGAAPLASGYRR